MGGLERVSHRVLTEDILAKFSLCFWAVVDTAYRNFVVLSAIRQPKDKLAGPTNPRQALKRQNCSSETRLPAIPGRQGQIP